MAKAVVKKSLRSIAQSLVDSVGSATLQEEICWELSTLFILLRVTILLQVLQQITVTLGYMMR